MVVLTVSVICMYLPRMLLLSIMIKYCNYLQANSFGCCSSAQYGRDIHVSTSKRPSNVKSSSLRTQQRTLTMDFSQTTSYSTRQSPEPSPWLQLWETLLLCVLLGAAGKYGHSSFHYLNIADFNTSLKCFRILCVEILYQARFLSHNKC